MTMPIWISTACAVIFCWLESFFGGSWNWNFPRVLGSGRETKQNNKGRTGLWLQPIWKILVKLEIFPKKGVKIKNIWNHHLEEHLSCFAFCWASPTVIGCNLRRKPWKRNRFFSLKLKLPSGKLTYPTLDQKKKENHRQTSVLGRDMLVPCRVNSNEIPSSISLDLASKKINSSRAFGRISNLL